MQSVETLAHNLKGSGGTLWQYLPALGSTALGSTALGINKRYVLYIHGMCQTEKEGADGAASFMKFAEMMLNFLW